MKVEYYDFNILTKLEEQFTASKDKNILGQMYSEMSIATKMLLNSYLKTKGLIFTIDRKEEIIHDASTRLIEMYLKREYYSNVPFNARLKNELIFQLHNKKLQKIEKTNTPLLDVHNNISDEREAQLIVCEFVDNINKDTQVDGKRIVVDLYCAKYYKTAIKKIATYTPKEWMYNNAVQLNTIFKILRGNK